MAELMATSQKTVTPVVKGEVMEGKITKLTNEEILVDINAKTEAVVLEKDSRLLRTLLSTLKVGDTVTVSVLNAESDMGYPVVSLRRFLDNSQWKVAEQKQKNQEPVTVTIKEVTRGGYVVESSFGLGGFLPLSQLVDSEEPTSQSSELLGKRLEAYVQEVQRANTRIIFSQRPILTGEAFTQATKTIKVGEKVQVTVSHAAPFGLFVLFSKNPTLNGFIHISEVSWEDVKDLSELFPKGKEFEAVITGIDQAQKRIELSAKRLTADPFKEQVEKLGTDQKVKGTVTSISSIGVEVDFVHEGNSFTGIIRKEKIPVNMTLEKGSSVDAIVSQVDTHKRKIFLVPALKEKPMGYR
jgi:small subunit ribosomal protein S1